MSLDGFPPNLGFLATFASLWCIFLVTSNEVPDKMGRLSLEIFDEEMAVVRLDCQAEPPPWFDWTARPIASVTRTDEETSIVCPANLVPPEAQAERGWQVIKVRGPLAFSLTGVLHSILAPLAAEQVSVFTLSTFDTDYVLIRQADMPRALAALRPDFDVVASRA